MKKLFKNPFLILGGVIAAIYFFNRNQKQTVNGINRKFYKAIFTNKKTGEIIKPEYVVGTGKNKTEFKNIAKHEFYKTIQNRGSDFINKAMKNVKITVEEVKRKSSTVNGIKTHIDLFEDFENIPTKIKKILNKYENAFIDGNYTELTKALNEIRKNGYTFDFYLDGQAYGLRPLNIPLEKLKGYENL